MGSKFLPRSLDRKSPAPLTLTSKDPLDAKSGETATAITGAGAIPKSTLDNCHESPPL